MTPLTVKFDCKSPATNQQVIDRLNELETLIYSSSYEVITITNNYSINRKTGIIIILCDTTARSIVVHLPSAIKNNTIINIKKISADSNTVTIKPYGAETIDDGTEAVIFVQDVSIECISDKINWKVI